MMTEYALLSDSGIVTNIVMSRKTLSEIRESYPDQRVECVSKVPMNVLQRYRYWNARP